MFEYIKKVSFAFKILSQKIDSKNKNLSNLFLKESLELLEMSLRLRNEEFGNPSISNNLQVLKNKILFLIDLINFGRIDNSVSLKNAQIFIESLTAFLRHLDQLISEKEMEVNGLESSLLDLENETKNLVDISTRKNAKNNLQNKFLEETYLNKNQDFKTQTYTEKLQEDVLKQIEQIDKNIGEHLDDESQLKIELEARRMRIIKELQKGGGSIKDISSVLTDINEKTIQRDLIELMRERRVIMLGKKRWAKYYLK